MRVFLLNPNGVAPNPHLFPLYKPTWIEKGCEFVDNIQDCDIVFIDFHSRIGSYYQSDIDFILNNTPTLVTFCEWDRGNMSADNWPYPLTLQQLNVFDHYTKNNTKAVHFCRLLDKTKEYPDNVFPYEKPTLHEKPIEYIDHLFEREFDICWIANTAPSREAIAKRLLEDGRLKCNIHLGETKIPFDQFIAEHKKAKLFISSAAGGFTDERVQHLYSIAGIIRQKTDQLLLHDFTDLVNCIRISSPPTDEEIENILEVVNDKKFLFEIYLHGYTFVRHYYSAAHIATNILETIQKHIS
jgi:hypothetical protein